MKSISHSTRNKIMTIRRLDEKQVKYKTFELDTVDHFDDIDEFIEYYT